MRKYSVDDGVSFRVRGINHVGFVMEVLKNGYKVCSLDDGFVYEVPEDSIISPKRIGKNVEFVGEINPVGNAINTTDVILEEIDKIKREISKPRWESGYLRAKFGV